jgi:hypothetical protein
MERLMTPNIRAEIRANLEMLATPIDFSKLEAEGAIKKKGAWYEVLDGNKIPEHARKKGKAIKAIKNRKTGKTHTLVKFFKNEAKAKRLLDRHF